MLQSIDIVHQAWKIEMTLYPHYMVGGTDTQKTHRKLPSAGFVCVLEEKGSRISQIKKMKIQF